MVTIAVLDNVIFKHFIIINITQKETNSMLVHIFKYKLKRSPVKAQKRM